MKKKLKLPLWILPIIIFLSVKAVHYQINFLPERWRHFFGLWGNKVDLRVYLAGAHRFVEGSSVYDGIIQEGLKYTYTPFSTIIFSGFEWISTPQIYWVWNSLSLAALFTVIVLSFRSLDYQINWLVLVVAAGLTAAFTLLEPVRDTIWFGQVNLLLLVIIMADLLNENGVFGKWLWRKNFQGIGVGFAAGIKLTPAFLIIYLFTVGKFRAGVVAGFAFIGSIVIGFIFAFTDSIDYWFGALHDSTRVGAKNNESNQSLTGALSLMDHHNPITNNYLYVPLALVVAIFGLGAAYLAYRVGQRVLSVVLAGMTTATVSPISWGHHWVWVVPLLVFILHHFIQAITHKKGWIALLSLVGFTAVFATFFSWMNPWHGRGLHGFPGLYFLRGVDEWRWFTAQPYLWVFGITATLMYLWYFRVYRYSRANEMA